MNEVRRRKVTWPAWLDGQKVAAAGVVIAFGAFIQIGFSGMSSDVNQLRGDVNQRISELRGDMNQRVSELRGDMNQQISELRGDMTQLRGDMNQLRGDMNHQVSELRGELGRFRSDVDVRLRAIETDVHAVKVQLAVVDTRLSAVERHVGIDGPSQEVADAGPESRQTPY